MWFFRYVHHCVLVLKVHLESKLYTYLPIWSTMHLSYFVSVTFVWCIHFLQCIRQYELTFVIGNIFLNWLHRIEFHFSFRIHRDQMWNGHCGLKTQGPDVIQSLQAETNDLHNTVELSYQDLWFNFKEIGLLKGLYHYWDKILQNLTIWDFQKWFCQWRLSHYQ